MALSCLISGTATFLFLWGCGYYARLRSQNRFVEPDYVRYYSQGYSFEPISNKTSLLLNIADDGELKRSMIITLDKTKHTLDLLDIPCEVRFFADGFSGSTYDAYKTGIYKILLSKALLFPIDEHITLTSDAFSYLINSLLKENEKSFFEVPSSLNEFHGLLNSSFEAIERIGAENAFSRVMNTLLNSKEGSMSLEDHIDFFNGINKVTKNKMNIHLFEYDTVASVLNESFRVPPDSVSMSELSLQNESDERINNK